MDASRTARGIRLVAAVATVAVAILVAAVSWSDSGGSALVLAGVPTLAAAPLLPAVPRRHAIVATWTAAVVVLAWAVLTGLGTGLYFAAPGLLLLVAAIASLAAESSTARTTGTTTSAP